MIVILGGGLAGLATAYFLGDLPHVVLEGDEAPGGLCRSRTIDGFVFDYTGHLLHMRDPRAVKLLDTLWPETFDVISRNASIRTRGVTVPFPFQANLHGLPGEVEPWQRPQSDEASHAAGPAAGHVPPGHSVVLVHG